MKTLHLDLKLVGDNYAELRFFFDNPNDYKTRSLPLEEIADLIQLAEQDYYVRLHEDYAITGRKLYNWLDGSDRFLAQAIQQYPGETLVLAIAATASLAHLPWEVLHDGNSFLVARMPAVVPVRWVSSANKISIEAEPENRALNVLFMATSPLDVNPVLDFEAEEGRILEATARHQIGLTVEESGCLSELGYLVADYDQGYFDIFHLTGHATLTDGQPRFITETETGASYPASARDIAKALKSRIPKLIFLSGCRTGQLGNSGAVPSLAEELLNLGAKAVLGWGQKVLDDEAALAAAALYEALSRGDQLIEAIAYTYQSLIEKQARDWHLLRLYVGGTLPGQLVTTLRTPGRKPAPKPSVTEQFLDPAGKVKVPTRASFVGRRRQLQCCLRALKLPSEMVGVLIHGMGGLGKSSLASRLCDRLPEFEHLIWVGRVDEGNLVTKLTAKLPKELRQILQSNDDELKFRLRDVFSVLREAAAKPFLLILDDFEANLEARDDGYVLQPEAAMVLDAVVWAIDQTYAAHRLILTCRYDFESALLQKFYKQPLEGMRGADLRKKCSSLSAFDSKSQVDEALQSQARRLADGNPRLLEWLDKVLLNLDPSSKLKVDPPQPPFLRGENLEDSVKVPLLKGDLGGSNREKVAEILARLEADPVELREQVLAKALLEQINQPLEEILQQALVFELPVPREAIAAVCEGIPNLEQLINRAVALGLLEVSPDFSLRVPRILPLQLKEYAELHKQAADVLYRLWWEEAESPIEEQSLEIHRLALRGKEKEIAARTADILASHWKNKGRYFEVVQLCHSTLTIAKDYRVLHQLARAEECLGDVDNALDHYQQALDLCFPEDEKAKGDIIHNLAEIYATQGQFEKALALNQQSLELTKRINDNQGKASALHQKACLKFNQGQSEEALALYEQSLNLNSDIQGKAATLHQMGMIKANQEKIGEAITLFKQSLVFKKSLGNFCNVYGKAMTLQWLGILVAGQGDVFAALEYLLESLEILQRLQSPEAEKVRKFIDWTIIARVQRMRDDS